MQNRESRWSKGMQAGITTAVLVTLLFPSVVQADLDSLKQERSRQQQLLDEAKAREKAAKEQKDKFQQEININAEEINKLADEIDTKEAEISKLQSTIYVKSQQIETKKQELEEAEARVKERDKLVKQRLRLMYENGEVQYLEVLLGSTSFTDFLERFDAISMIFEQDKNLLEQNKKDRDEVAALKLQFEEERTTLSLMKDQQVAQKSELDALKGQKLAINEKLEASKQDQERIEQQQVAIQEAAIKSMYAIAQQEEEERRKLATAPKPVPGTGSGGSAPEFTGPFVWPVPSSWNITSEWGNRIDPFTGMRAGHNGMDIGAPTGTGVVAAQSGTVIRAGMWGGSGFGNCIIIDHGGGLWSLYGHLVDGGVLVSVGQEVTQGQIIGKIGSTGRSTGPHLHFGVYERGADINPRKYL